MREFQTPVLIVGGGTGGVAAALAVARRGLRCVMVESTDWIGGQLTSQAVPPDEHRWIEGTEGFHGATASYIDYRNRVRAWYRRDGRLTFEAQNDPNLNPGGGWVSRICHSPAVGHAVLQDMLAPHVQAGRITVLLNCHPVSADVERGRIRTVTLRGPEGDVVISADFVLDASELGDLLPMTGAAFHLGSEGKGIHGELHAPEQGCTDDVQAITWCFAVEHRAGEDHRMAKPEGYEQWRDWIPPLTPRWPGPLFSWTIDTVEKPRTLNMVPPPDEPQEGKWELWRYRRIVDAAVHTDGRLDVALWNTVQNDYFRSTPFDDPQAADKAKHQALCFLYWMQTDAPRHDDGHGYPGLRLRGEELGTGDGFAKAPYIREARRLAARTMVTERHIGFAQRTAEGLADTTRCDKGTGEAFADSVGVGHYSIDLHPSAAMRNFTDVAATPFRIPLGSLLPAEGSGPANLIAAGKCLGVSHIANGCYRLHPVEWNIGDAAGALAGWCIERKGDPAWVHADQIELRAFQRDLVRDGFELAWPWEEGEGL